MIEALLPITTFSLAGRVLMAFLLAFACLTGLSGIFNLCGNKPARQQTTTILLIAVNLIFAAGFIWICWFHYQINRHLPLEMPGYLVNWLNDRLAAINNGAAYALPPYDPANPPRYVIPVWIENEKYYFWFMCYGIMALIAHFRMQNRRLKAVLHIFLAIQVIILFFAANPFARPLPKFFAEIRPWFAAGTLQPMHRLGLFMKLYSKMIFYYNAHYMWLHPPLLFLSYAAITITFTASMFMLAGREAAIEFMGYDFAKFGYLMLTLGMLLGYPWALQAWGPNWWWDPKICSSIMMWAIFTTYLHTRLYANKPGMWYFSSILGIICFIAMIFTFLTSFFFPGEHTFQ